MKIDYLVSKSSNQLSRVRSAFINAQIKAEKGLTGYLRKTGSKLISKNEELEYFNNAQGRYYQTLSEYQELIINEFQRSNRRLIFHDILTIAQITVFDEIETLRQEKEKKLRSRGVMGIIRTQLQEWRQISPNFKMIFGLTFIAASSSLFFVSIINIRWLQIPVLAWGVMLLIEGIQQKSTQRKAAKKGLNREKIFQLAKRRLPQNTRSLSQDLARIHRKLEQDIWKLRVYEKRTEYRRYLIAAFSGIATTAFFFIPYGLKTAIITTVSAIFSRLAWFLLPYGAIQNSITGIFKPKTAQASESEEIDAGEGSASVSRADQSDPSLVAAASQADTTRTADMALTSGAASASPYPPLPPGPLPAAVSQKAAETELVISNLESRGASDETKKRALLGAGNVLPPQVLEDIASKHSIDLGLATSQEGERISATMAANQQDKILEAKNLMLDKIEADAAAGSTLWPAENVDDIKRRVIQTSGLPEDIRRQMLQERGVMLEYATDDTTTQATAPAQTPSADTAATATADTSAAATPAETTTTQADTTAAQTTATETQTPAQTPSAEVSKSQADTTTTAATAVTETSAQTSDTAAKEQADTSSAETTSASTEGTETSPPYPPFDPSTVPSVSKKALETELVLNKLETQGVPDEVKKTALLGAGNVLPPQVLENIASKHGIDLGLATSQEGERVSATLAANRDDHVQEAKNLVLDKIETDSAAGSTVWPAENVDNVKLKVIRESGLPEETQQQMAQERGVLNQYLGYAEQGSSSGTEPAQE
ncbi:MAG: hypothetical protein ABIC19_02850 [Patescibacteria group bacterium]|nr:hypothetical protein [Patescibacteria group bacterium]